MHILILTIIHILIHTNTSIHISGSSSSSSSSSRSSSSSSSSGSSGSSSSSSSSSGGGGGGGGSSSSSSSSSSSERQGHLTTEGDARNEQPLPSRARFVCKNSAHISTLNIST